MRADGLEDGIDAVDDHGGQFRRQRIETRVSLPDCTSAEVRKVPACNV
jgi:hypothetical protein